MDVSQPPPTKLVALPQDSAQRELQMITYKPLKSSASPSDLGPLSNVNMSSLNPPALTASKTPSPVRYVDTASAYDLWSDVYDTDGNFLQALDTMEMKSLLPGFLQQIRSSKPWKVVDLGCGTGRNTVPLLRIPGASIVGLDLSRKMLDVAKSRLDKEFDQIAEHERAQSVELEMYDMIQQPHPPDNASEADAVISTLVLEHITADIFFKAASQLLKADGVLLVTNMHSEMGKISQAGFTDPKSGEKIRPTSYAHTVLDVVTEAKNQGFKLEGDVLEREVDEAGSIALWCRAKKWIGVMVWYGMMFRKVAEGHTD